MPLQHTEMYHSPLLVRMPRRFRRQLSSAGLLVVLFAMACGSTVLAQSAPKSPVAADNGVFTILSKNRQIGTEKFKITPQANGLEAIGEIQVDMPGSPRVTEDCTLKLDEHLQPASYFREQRAPKKGTLTAQFSAQGSKLTTKTAAGTEERIFILPDNHLAVLDTNFFHHYALLLRQYDGSHPGPQHLNVFIPQEATPGTISLELKGKESQTVGKAARELNHFQAITDQIKIEIWAGPEGEIYRISIPEANLEVVRQ